MITLMNNNSLKYLTDEYISNGYIKFKAQCLKSFDVFDQQIKNIISKYDVDLEMLHTKIDSNDVNTLRLKCFKELNSINNWEHYLYNIGGPVIDAIFGHEISIQNKINFSIQLPNDTTSQIPLHTDRASGHSLFESVLWTSLTTSTNTAAMYLTDIDSTIEILNDLQNFETIGGIQLEEKYKNKFKFISVNPGDCILFSSNLYHGNVVNRESKTRMSFNCRIKPVWAPEVKSFPNERITGSFYKPFKFSPSTKVATRFLNNEPKF